jgi:hypothetical protein
MPLFRNVMKDPSEVIALEPFGGRIELVQIGGVGVGRLFFPPASAGASSWLTAMGQGRRVFRASGPDPRHRKQAQSLRQGTSYAIAWDSL